MCGIDRVERMSTGHIEVTLSSDGIGDVRKRRTGVDTVENCYWRNEGERGALD